MRFCGVNTGTEFHLLDHIAPLSAILKMPLIVTEEKNYALAKKYYPQVETRFIPDLEFNLSYLAKNFDALFECRYWYPHLKTLFQTLYGKSMRLVFCPHGQSDKGYQHPTLAPYADQDAVLLYGDLLIEMLKELQVYPSIQNACVTGNYRAYFYEKQGAFYKPFIDALNLEKKNKTLLYAPTWKDSDRSTSFFEKGRQVIDTLPKDWNLIVRVHPLLEQRDPGRYYSIAALVDKKPNARLIGEFPPVYPMLQKVDAYLGDASSVGYDFLYFQKPMFLFPDDRKKRLTTCAKIIDSKKEIYSQLDLSNPYKEKQKALYQYAFGAPVDEESLRKTILKSISPK